jgi:hypothetical protein
VGAAVAMSMGVLAGITAIVKTIYLPRLYSVDGCEFAPRPRIPLATG